MGTYCNRTCQRNDKKKGNRRRSSLEEVFDGNILIKRCSEEDFVAEDAGNEENHDHCWIDISPVLQYLLLWDKLLFIGLVPFFFFLFNFNMSLLFGIYFGYGSSAHIRSYISKNKDSIGLNTTVCYYSSWSVTIANGEGMGKVVMNRG